MEWRRTEIVHAPCEDIVPDLGHIVRRVGAYHAKAIAMAALIRRAMVFEPQSPPPHRQLKRYSGLAHLHRGDHIGASGSDPQDKHSRTACVFEPPNDLVRQRFAKFEDCGRDLFSLREGEAAGHVSR
jgi:hypothetical protein